jgi:hypothetical protein
LLFWEGFLSVFCGCPASKFPFDVWGLPHHVTIKRRQSILFSIGTEKSRCSSPLPPTLWYRDTVWAKPFIVSYFQAWALKPRGRKRRDFLLLTVQWVWLQHPIFNGGNSRAELNRLFQWHHIQPGL